MAKNGLLINKETKVFFGVIFALFGAFASIGSSFVYQQQNVENQITVQDQYKTDFFRLKEDLEDCQNKSKDKSIKIESFELLLQHITYQDVPFREMRAMIKKCQSTL